MGKGISGNNRKTRRKSSQGRHLRVTMCKNCVSFLWGLQWEMLSPVRVCWWCLAEPPYCQGSRSRTWPWGHPPGNPANSGPTTARHLGPTAVALPLQAPHHVKPPGQLQVLLVPDHLEEVQMPRQDGGIEGVDITARPAPGEGYSPCKPPTDSI